MQSKVMVRSFGERATAGMLGGGGQVVNALLVQSQSECNLNSECPRAHRETIWQLCAR